MRLRTALDEYKRRRGEPFPGEAPTTTGAFSGYGDRLVYVEHDGSFRDHSAALSGLYGVARSRFGIETAEETYWFGDIEPIRQHYYRETSLVETEYDAGAFTIHQYDLTLGRAHLTHFEVRGEVPPDARLVGFLRLAPEGRETQLGRLVHENAGYHDDRVVEVYHRSEHDYVAASTPIETAVGQVAESLEEILDDDPIDYPREAAVDALEKEAMTGDVVVSATLERAGRAARTTLVTQLSDHTEIDREQAIANVTGAARRYDTVEDIREAARKRVETTVPDAVPRPGIVRADLRTLSLLTAPTGARIAAPEFDYFYEHSGGYGYTWFRDDAEISLALLDVAGRLDLDLADGLRESARLYCRTQLPGGAWPHRIWAADETLAPGWANEHIEGEGLAYQADQTATVTAFLARLLAERNSLLSPEERAAVASTVESAVERLDATLTTDGLPEPCQNAWENMYGQFAHTTATYLRAYARVAAAPVDPDLREHAAEQADHVLAGLDTLWSDEAECYAMRRFEGELDERADAAAFAVAEGVSAYADLAGLDAAPLDRVRTHVETLLDRLTRETPAGTGLIRYEGDHWRTNGQADEKLWSVTTAKGASAVADLGVLVREAGGDARPLFERAAGLYEALLPGGPFVNDAGFIAEQTFDDGRPDSATPLCWSHAVRLRTTGLLRDVGALPTASPPAGPDERATWTTGEKYGVGTVADHDAAEPSSVWFTLTEGALTEVRYPRIDTMNIRTLDFLVVDAAPDADYVARTHNETRTDDHAETLARETVLARDDALVYRQTVTETGDGRGHEWTLTAEYVADPDHDAVLADVSFEAADGKDYEVYAVVDTALTSTGTSDRGVLLGGDGDYSLAARDASAFDVHHDDSPLVDEDGTPLNVALALTSASRFDWASVEVAGTDHLDRLIGSGETPPPNERADESRLLLVGRVGTGRSVADRVALGFAREADTAGALGEADGALARGFERVREDYVASWQSYLADKAPPASVSDDDDLRGQYWAAVMTLRACEDKTYDGAAIASPSVPWGEAVAADEPKGYGYNFVWARDLYQTVTALLAVGERDTAHDALAYVYEYQQDERGFIPQNTYLDGRTRWGGEQMDNISFPAVMAYQLEQAGLTVAEADYAYDDVRASLDYVVREGPETAQERWEEEAGFSPSSIAAEIAGLACGAAVADARGETGDALVWYALADDWVRSVEGWTATTTGTETLTETPYYVRITRDGDPDATTRRALANGGPRLDEREIVDAGFLELVRLGLVPPDDAVIRNSLAVVDETIRVETPNGPCFYRYVGDGYGERTRDEPGAPWHPDSPDGKGRLWPIFTGERAEYALLAEDARDDPERLLAAMAGFANSGRMIPEQVWDRETPTEYNWRFGEGTGSATPLCWSMAQFVRLAHGIDAGEPIERPAVTRRRYLEGDRPAGPSLWVDTGYEGDSLVVTIETDGDLVAVKTEEETVTIEPTSGEFVVRVAASRGDDPVTVAAATGTDLDTAGTTVRRLTL